MKRFPWGLMETHASCTVESVQSFTTELQIRTRIWPAFFAVIVSGENWVCYIRDSCCTILYSSYSTISYFTYAITCTCLVGLKRPETAQLRALKLSTVYQP